jgi:hypothetical protein
MRCEFMKDENGTIWFTYASKVIVRPVKKHKENESHFQKVKFINKAHQKQLMDQLNVHREEQA